MIRIVNLSYCPGKGVYKVCMHEDVTHHPAAHLVF